jgi:large subunit ribosomal protein L30
MVDTTSDMIKVRLVGSPIGTTERVRETVRGLGLRKVGSESTIKRSPSVEGMIRRLKHLVVEVKE